jgi:CRP/FNR family transcriptional regulator, cyclic AMP receptor protein
MASDPTIDVLGSVPLFEGLSKKELAQVNRLGKVVETDAGATLVEEGSHGVGFHVILEGTATVSVEGEQRAVLKAKDFFGELSLLDNGPRSATVTAETPLRTLWLDSYDFLGLVDRNPAIARKLLVEVARRLRQLERSHTH